LPNGTEAALAKIREIASKATECDQIIFETHTYVVDVEDPNSERMGLGIGGKEVRPFEAALAKLADAFKGTKAAYGIVLGSCRYTEKEIQDFANRSGKPTAGSSGSSHPVWPVTERDLHTPPEGGVPEPGSNVVRDVNETTPYARQEYNKVPQPSTKAPHP